MNLIKSNKNKLENSFKNTNKLRNIKDSIKLNLFPIINPNIRKYKLNNLY
jgi:hypothetical protein